MKQFLIYILQSMVCGGIFLLLYRLLLEGRVRPTLCRVYLLATVVMAAVIPAISIPVYSGETIYYTPQAVETVGNATSVFTNEAVKAFDPSQLILWIYAAVTLLAGFLFAKQLAAIFRLKKGSEKRYGKDYILYINGRVKSPFSFFRSIFAGTGYGRHELEQIICHEKSHIRHLHSAELVVMEMMRMVFWFNPLVWIARKWLVEVHEYQADTDVLEAGYSLADYQSLIFKQLCGFGPDIANGLNSSLTKKRFIMMTKKIPRGRGLLRVASVLPAAGALMMFFSFTNQEPVYIASTDTTSHEHTMHLVYMDNEMAFEGEVVIGDTPHNGSVSGTMTTEDGTVVNIILVESTQGEEYRQNRPEERPGEIDITVFTYDGNIPNLLTENRSTDPAVAERLRVDGRSTDPEVDGISPHFFIAEVRREPPREIEVTLGLDGSNTSNEVITVSLTNKGTTATIHDIDNPPTQENTTTITRTRKVTVTGGPESTEMSTTSTRRSSPQPESERKVIKNDAKITSEISFSDFDEEEIIAPAYGAGNNEADDDAPFLSVELMPGFQGGDLSNFHKWVMERIKLPKIVGDASGQFLVTAEFVIDKTGQLKDIRILQSPEKAFSDEVVRVLSLSPEWTPGKQSGKTVNVKYIMPVRFSF